MELKKKCIECEQILPLGNYLKRVDKGDKVGQRYVNPIKKYMSICKECYFKQLRSKNDNGFDYKINKSMNKIAENLRLHPSEYDSMVMIHLSRIGYNYKFQQPIPLIEKKKFYIVDFIIKDRIILIIQSKAKQQEQIDEKVRNLEDSGYLVKVISVQRLRDNRSYTLQKITKYIDDIINIIE